MADLRKLAESLNRYADVIEEAPNKVASSVALLLVDGLTTDTPVDTSKAISNWLLSLDDPVFIELDAYFEGLRGSTATASKAEAVSFAESKLKNKKPGQDIFIANNAPYIRDLNDGSSAQAPALFIERRAFLVRQQIKPLFKQVLKNGR